MKQLLTGILLFSFTAGSFAQVKTKKVTKSVTKKVTTTSLSLKNSSDSFSYAVGASIAGNMMHQGINQINYNALLEGMDVVFKKQPRLMDDNQCGSVIQKRIQELLGKRLEVEKATGKAFLDANKKRANVKTTATGLQYEIIKSGPDSNTTRPKVVDTVVVNYAGSLTDGKEFENSYKLGQPAVFPLKSVMAGWIEILQLMKIGDQWRVYIPSDLAYGDRGAGASIPPGAALIFDISLEGIKPAKIQ